MPHADAPMNCWRKRSSCTAPDQTKANPGQWPGFVKLASMLLSGGRRIDGPFVGAEVAEQHLTGLQIFLGEATACWPASIDRASGDSGAAYDRSAAHDRSAGNRRGIRHAHAAAAVEVGIDVGVR